MADFFRGSVDIMVLQKLLLPPRAMPVIRHATASSALPPKPVVNTA